MPMTNPAYYRDLRRRFEELDDNIRGFLESYNYNGYIPVKRYEAASQLRRAERFRTDANQMIHELDSLLSSQSFAMDNIAMQYRDMREQMIKWCEFLFDYENEIRRNSF